MGEPTLSILTVTGLLVSISGLIISIITLSTARTIYNRLKDKRISRSYLDEINKKIDQIERNSNFLPSDFNKETQNLCLNALAYVRKNKIKKIHNRVKNIQKINLNELLLLLKEISIEITDEGL